MYIKEEGQTKEDKERIETENRKRKRKFRKFVTGSGRQMCNNEGNQARANPEKKFKKRIGRKYLEKKRKEKDRKSFFIF